MSIQALKAGKNVFSAVPMGITEEEIFEIIRLVEETGLIYMMGETCYYFPTAIFCRDMRKKGEFGNITYAEAQYYHDITEFFGSYNGSGNKEWMKDVGIPPMYYSTHSMSMAFSSVDDYPVEVTAFGYTDITNDELYGEGFNHWNNPYSNQTAILRMSKGGLVRINEFRRIATIKPSSYITGIYGDKGCYEASGMQHLFMQLGVKGAEKNVRDVSGLVNSDNYANHLKNGGKMEDGVMSYSYHRGFSPIHPKDRLPKELWHFNEGLHKPDTDGHGGSHPFLVDDFAKAVSQHKLPPLNAWTCAHYTLPGIYAHESILKGSVTLKLPEIPKRSEKWEYLEV
jgi:predicted dehydrogenase